jgi:hypothetical protein
MVNIMIGESAAKLLSKVPLSNNTISRRIQHIAEDRYDQLIEKMRAAVSSLILRFEKMCGDQQVHPSH